MTYVKGGLSCSHRRLLLEEWIAAGTVHTKRWSNELWIMMCESIREASALGRRLIKIEHLTNVWRRMIKISGASGTIAFKIHISSLMFDLVQIEEHQVLERSNVSIRRCGQDAERSPWIDSQTNGVETAAALGVVGDTLFWCVRTLSPMIPSIPCQFQSSAMSALFQLRSRWPRFWWNHMELIDHTDDRRYWWLHISNKFLSFLLRKYSRDVQSWALRRSAAPQHAAMLRMIKINRIPSRVLALLAESRLRIRHLVWYHGV